MKSKDLKTLRDKDTKELEKKVNDLRAQVIKTAPRLLAGKEKNLKVNSKIRHEIAQILGIIQDKKKNA